MTDQLQFEVGYQREKKTAICLKISTDEILKIRISRFIRRNNINLLIADITCKNEGQF